VKQLVQHKDSGLIEVLEVPEPKLGDRAVRVRTLFSVISAGTERSSVQVADKSLIGKARARPDLVKKVIDSARKDGVWATVETVRNRLKEAAPMGYSLSGVVEEVGPLVEGIAPGDRVAAGGVGYANHAEVAVVPHNLVVPLPDGAGADAAAYTTLGAIALQGLRQAEPEIGETFLVIGLGLLGQITVQLLKANGCRVLAFDLVDDLIRRAEGHGAVGVRSGEGMEQAILNLTAGQGVDGVLITASTDSSQPVQLAGEATREKGRVVVVGAVGMTLPREPYYMKEIDFRISRSYGPGRYDRGYEESGQDYPYGYVRFTEQRNMAAFLDLIAEKRIDVGSLTTHRFPLSEAPQAYDIVRGKSEEPHLGILLDYGGSRSAPGPIALAAKQASEGRLGVSFVGAGNYATSKLLPVLKADPRVRLSGVSTASGLKARDVGERFGFDFCSGTVDDLLTDKTDVLFIASRHDSHANYALRGLRAKKHVFVEKPLALTAEELAEVETVARGASGHLLVGFNRRFAPLTQAVTKFVAGSPAATTLNIRVNAGSIDKQHWIQDPAIGGGRIVGEVCHFVDLAAALTGSLPIWVQAERLGQDDTPAALCDNLVMTLGFANGSLASITYVSSGSRKMEKERVELFRGGFSAVIDDFKTATLFSPSKAEKVRHGSQNKGQKEMLEAFLASLATSESLAPLDSLVATTRATFAAVESLATGGRVSLWEWEP